MKYISKILAIALVSALLSANISVSSSATAAALDSHTAPPSTEPIRAIIVNSLNNRDFPYAPNQSSKSLKKQINSIVDYSDKGGYNSLFFQVRSQGEALYGSKNFPKSQFLVKNQGDFTFFDPLKQFVSTADKKGMEVYAVINPFYLGSNPNKLHKTAQAIKNPELCLSVGNRLYLSPFIDEAVNVNIKDISELVSKYDVKGIIIEGLDDSALTFQDNYSTAVNNFVSKLSASIKAENSNIKLGISIKDSAISKELASQLTQGFDLVLPAISGNIEYTDSPYVDNLSKWLSVGEADVIPVTNISNINSPTTGAMLTDPNQAVYQSYLNSQIGTEGIVVDGYRQLRYGFFNLDSGLSSLNFSTNTKLLKLDFKPQQTLNISYPKNNYRTNLSKFYVTGTSAVGIPITLNGKEVEVNSTNGTFGALVDLENGKNTITFKQGSATSTIVIERFVPPSTPQPTNKLTGILPSNFTIARSGEEFSLRCTAPAGSTVSATLGGTTYSLKQTTATQVASVPAAYSAPVTLNASNPNEFKDLGKVNFTLVHGGKTTSYTSEGNVYLLGKNATPMVRVTSDTASIYPTDELIDGAYKAIYKLGTTEAFTLDNNYSVKLASGGYIKKSAVELVDGSTLAPVSVSAITAYNDLQQQSFTLVGGNGLPFELSQDDDGVITLNLLGSYDLSTLSLPPHELFSSIKLDSSTPNQTKLIFTPNKPEDIWGYDIFYTENDAVMFFKKAPVRSDDAFKPLKNLVVVLDPGHGGADPGALGVLRTFGPHESEINITTATAIKTRLEQMGATVYMTREDDSTHSLVERARFTADKLPHVSISTHHNSLAESSNSNNTSGVEGYYYYDVSKDLSDTVVKHLTLATNRKLRGSFKANYIVTKYNYAKSMLLEIGYLPNPMEYQRVVDDMEIFKTSCAVSSALIDLVNR